MVRARLTADEWTALRTLALTVKRPVADLVADAIRNAYPAEMEAARNAE